MKKPSSQYILMQTLKEMMRNRRFDDIAVYEILQESGVSRATFYKYFYTKESLLETLLYTDLAKPNFYDLSRPIAERKQETLENLRGDKAFYLHALETSTVQRFWKYHAAQSLYQYYSQVRGIDSPELMQVCEFLAEGIVKFNLNCITSDAAMSAQTLSKLHENLVEGAVSSCCRPAHAIA